ncbi:MAG: phenylalanine--tRNA ligase subunit beta [Candidatus Bathyarchaeota archaeon]|nr:MAG: phenylalanine--tRNA ligase subunit beta [Candidatus Bathyarchaeota archaeon]
MPVINLDRQRFSKYVGKEVTSDEMADWLPWLGFDLEEVGEDKVKVEFNPNRIDFSSYAGVARAFKGLRGWETGLPEYDVKTGETLLNVESAVSEVRPFMLAAVVRGLKLEEDDVIDLMEMQEDLHWGIGRDRKKASIGVHNLDVVEPPFTFTAVEPESVKFVPLDKAEKMSLKEILEKHEKGKGYRHLVDWSPKYPLLEDKHGNVLSMPPIINGELTRVTEKTKALFLDVTGTDYNAVKNSLNVLSTAFAGMGGTIERVLVKYPGSMVESPNLDPQMMHLRTTFANKLLGLSLTDPQVIEFLEKCRLGAKSASRSHIDVLVPPYRIDILHEIDLVEEVAIGYGYYNLKPTLPSSVTIGKQHPAQMKANIARQIMIGFGFTEAMNFTLTNEAWHYTKMRRKPAASVKLANPVSTEYTIMRHDLLPSLMKNLADNKHESFPQKLFEVSDVVWINNQLDTGCQRRLHVAAVSSHPTSNFTEMKSVTEALLANLSLKLWKIGVAKHPSFINGRAANIRLRSETIGMVGEIHPEVLNNFALENPTTAFEIDLEEIA